MSDQSYAPFYCAFYPDLADIARRHGYALAIHALNDGFHLACLPWENSPDIPQNVVDAICAETQFQQVAAATPRLHGRICYTIVPATRGSKPRGRIELSFFATEPLDRSNYFLPDYVTPPGATLLEILEERGMTQASLARQLNRPKKTINEIIHGKVAITVETAVQLEEWLPEVSARFWLQREIDYRLALNRLARK